MKKVIILTWLPFFLANCASNETQIKESLKKNPKIVFDVIEKNPEQFLEVVNRAARKAQQGQYEKQIVEMQAQQEKDLKNPKRPKLSADRRLIGNEANKITLVEYADFQCPACKNGL